METKLTKQRERTGLDMGRMLYILFMILLLLSMTALPVFAEEGQTIWSKASEVMQDIYNQILGISTVAAIVTASIALLLMNFSKSGKTVDEARTWLKRIVITWAILNSMGLIMAYIGPMFQNGQWAPKP